jgi:hypothetical protein
MNYTAAACFLAAAGVGSLSSAEIVKVASAKVSYEPALKPIAEWSGNRLIVVERYGSLTPMFRLFDRTGHKIDEVPFALPGAGLLRITAWARSQNGTLAVCGFAADSAGRNSNFVAWIRPGGVKVVRTDNYEPAGIAITDDQSTWTIGSTYLPSSDPFLPKEYAPDPMIFRRWNQAGDLIASYVPQGKIRSVISIPKGAPYRVFASGGDRVGWLGFSENRYVEIATNGLIRDIPNLQLPPARPGSAYFLALLAHERDPYVGITHNKGWDLGKLDLSVRRIRNLSSGPPGTAFFLLGSDGNELVGIEKPPEDLLEFFHFR